MNEEWRAVVGFEGHYEVSSLGRVRRISASWKWPDRKLPYLLVGSWHKGGYHQVQLSVDDKTTCRKTHVLVAAAFIGPRPPGFEINHRDFDKRNNRPQNLEYVSTKDNVTHAYTFKQRRDAQPRGVKHANAVLTEAQVRRIQRGQIRSKDAVREFGISRATYTQIRMGRTWRHLL